MGGRGGGEGVLVRESEHGGDGFKEVGLRVSGAQNMSPPVQCY